AAALADPDPADPDAAATARRRYGCLSPWQGDPAWYGRAVLQGDRDACEDEVAAQLAELLARQRDYAARDGEDFADAAQNARIVRAAEQYYRIMYRGGNDSWNLRDRHMFDTLQHLLARRGPQAKAVVWAHNSHIRDASSTATGLRGQCNIGERSRTSVCAAAGLIAVSADSR